MAAPNCVPVLKQYLTALHERFDVREEAEGCLLMTPFYLPDNTRLAVHLVERPDGRLEITDFGETFDNLFLGGLTVPVDDKRIGAMSRRFGVTIEGGEISKTVTAATLSEAIDDVVHAILDMSYLVYTRKPRAAPNFAVEVEQLFMSFHRTYKKRFEVVGRTDTHVFDYHLPNQREPLLIDMLSTTSRSTSFERSRIIAYKAFDTKHVIAPYGYQFACLIDDRTPDHQDALTQRALAPLGTYLDSVVLWSERAKVEKLFAA